MNGSFLPRSAFTLFTTILGFALPAVAQEEGPRILFLDDLACGRRACARDPWQERMDTDRHDFTQSARTVGCGVSQIEMGYSYFYHDQNEEIEQAHTTPELMLRVGLTEDIEFRVRWNYVWLSVDEHGQDEGAEDLRWAFKLNVTEQDAWIPESALELRFTAPTGGEAFSTTRMEWGVDYIYDWRLTEACRLYGSTGVMANGLDDVGLLPEEPARERFLVWTQSVALGLEVTERTTVYNECFGLFSYGLEDEFANVFYNVGVDFYVTDNLVLDYRVGVGLTPDADDLFSGIGGGFRF